MADEITGISILQPTWVDGIYRLFIDCRRTDGKTSQAWIFIKDKTRTDVPNIMPDYAEGREQVWTFERNGDRLNCQPSVDYISFKFHNEGTWSTRYEELTFTERAESKGGDDDGPEPARIQRGISVHYDLNRVQQTDEQRAAFLHELKTQGAIR